MLAVLVGCILLAIGCGLPEDPNVELAKQYEIGDKVNLGGVDFFVYGKGTESINLITAQNVDITTYQGIETCIDDFKQKLKDAGVVIEYIGLLDYEDLDDLGGNKHTVAISGLPYLCDEVPDFIKTEESFWLGGYIKYDTYTWLYKYEQIDQVKFEDKEYGVRPVIRVLVSEINKDIE